MNENQINSQIPTDTVSDVAAPTVSPVVEEKKISIDDCKKVEMRVGLIKSAEPVIGTDKLLRLVVDFGVAGERQVVSGIAQRVDVATLADTRAIFVTNLEYRKIKGFESQAMILGAAEKNEAGEEIRFAIVRPDADVPAGTIVG